MVYLLNILHSYIIMTGNFTERIIVGYLLPNEKKQSNRHLSKESVTAWQVGSHISTCSPSSLMTSVVCPGRTSLSSSIAGKLLSSTALPPTRASFNTSRNSRVNCLFNISSSISCHKHSVFIKMSTNTFEVDNYLVSSCVATYLKKSIKYKPK